MWINFFSHDCKQLLSQKISKKQDIIKKHCNYYVIYDPLLQYIQAVSSSFPFFLQGYFYHKSNYWIMTIYVKVNVKNIGNFQLKSLIACLRRMRFTCEVYDIDAKKSFSRNYRKHMLPFAVNHQPGVPWLKVNTLLHIFKHE